MFTVRVVTVCVFLLSKSLWMLSCQHLITDIVSAFEESLRELVLVTVYLRLLGIASCMHIMLNFLGRLVQDDHVQ